MTTHVNAAGSNPLAGLGKMGCGLLGCGGLLLLALIIGGWMVGIYNNMVKEQETVETAWAQVENVYQRRMDLVPQLVETVRGAKEGEIEALERVTAIAEAFPDGLLLTDAERTAARLQWKNKVYFANRREA